MYYRSNNLTHVQSEDPINLVLHNVWRQFVFEFLSPHRHSVRIQYRRMYQYVRLDYQPIGFGLGEHVHYISSAGYSMLRYESSSSCAKV